MDRTIPAGAAVLLRFIYETETGRVPPECYDVIYGHNQGKLAKPVTAMTLREVQAEQGRWSKRFGSSATGAPQFMRATLKGLIGELHLSLEQRLDGDLQDRLAYHLLIRRGYHQFVEGEISRTEFGKRLAMEWASFPVLADTRGAHRNLVRGQSYYAGDSLNKSLTKPEPVERILDQVKAAARKPIEIPDPVKEVVNNVEKPGGKSTTNWAAGIMTAVGSAVAALSSLPTATQIVVIIVLVAGALYIWKERNGKSDLARKAREAIDQVTS